MFNLLKSDIYRLIKGQLGVIALLGLTVLAVFCGLISKDGEPAEALLGGLSMGTLILPIFFTTIYMITFGHEFAYRVVNNALIAGVKRQTYYASKVLLTFLLTILYTLVYTAALVVTLRVTAGQWLIGEASRVFIAQLPFYLGASSIGILCFNLIKTPYIAVAAFISLAFVGDSLVGSIIDGFLPKLSFVLDTFIFTNLGEIVGISDLSSQSVSKMMLSCVSYSLVLIASGYQSMKRREFK